jgi:hypothetical protein
MNKKITKAFNKKVYLLGSDKDGVYYWLEEPRWDCGWYWGFGYIETYTNNKNPEKAKDISSHSHAHNFVSKYFIELNGSKPILKNQTFTNKEGWELSELFSQFYHLSEQAEFWGRGKQNVSETKIRSWEDKILADKINQSIIPTITARILDILTPNE